MKAEFAEEAIADLEAAADYLSERSPVAATGLIDRVFGLVDRLATSEFSGPEITLRTGAVVRSWPVSPYRLYYQVDGERLIVLRVLHQARRPL